MSTWWQYQMITTVSKRVGGPINLLLLTGTTTAVIARGAEAGIKSLVKKVKRRGGNNTISDESPGPTYTVKAEADFGDGLRMSVGTEFYVVSCDGEITLIGILGDTSNPHVASTEILKENTDYPGA